ncbi:MAG: hypothetical protein WBD95_04020 [Xanthobacteraceae bacterium]
MRETVAKRSTMPPLIVSGVVIVIGLAGTGWLWVHYGTAVFFETIRAGFIACFG